MPTSFASQENSDYPCYLVQVGNPRNIPWIMVNCISVSVYVLTISFTWLLWRDKCRRFWYSHLLVCPAGYSRVNILNQRFPTCESWLPEFAVFSGRSVLLFEAAFIFKVGDGDGAFPHHARYWLDGACSIFVDQSALDKWCAQDHTCHLHFPGNI